MLLPNGQPAVGATVRAIKSVFRSNVFRQPPESTDRAREVYCGFAGRLRGNVEPGRLKEGEIKLDLVGHVARIRSRMHPIDSAEKTEPIVMSLADEEPIRGRIIDLEGRPLRDARVEVVRYTDTTTASIDKWLAMKLGKDAEYRNAILPAKPRVWVCR